MCIVSVRINKRKAFIIQPYNDLIINLYLCSQRAVVNCAL